MGARFLCGGGHSAARRRTQRTHLQSWSRDTAGDSGAKRKDAGGFRARARGKIFEGDDGMKAVLLLAHGSPDSASEPDIREFLNNVTGGRPLPDSAVGEIRSRYEQIGQSPLCEITQRQAQLLERELGMRVYVGMRNWRPYIADAVKQMASDGVSEAVAICLAPQNSRTSVGLYRKALESEGAVPFKVDFVQSWHDHPKLVEAFADKLLPAWKRACQESG